MNESGDFGELKYKVVADLAKVDEDIRAIQRKFDSAPIKLKLAIDDSSLREITSKIQHAVQSALRGSSGAGVGAGHNANVSGVASGTILGVGGSLLFRSGNGVLNNRTTISGPGTITQNATTLPNLSVNPADRSDSMGPGHLPDAHVELLQSIATGGQPPVDKSDSMGVGRPRNGGYSQFGRGISDWWNARTPGVQGPPMANGSFATGAPRNRVANSFVNSRGSAIIGATGIAIVGSVGAAVSYGQNQKSNVDGGPEQGYENEMGFAGAINTLTGGLGNVVDYFSGDRRGNAMRTIAEARSQNKWTERRGQNRIEGLASKAAVTASQGNYAGEYLSIGYNQSASVASAEEDARKLSQEVGESTVSYMEKKARWKFITDQKTQRISDATQIGDNQRALLQHGEGARRQVAAGRLSSTQQSGLNDDASRRSMLTAEYNAEITQNFNDPQKQKEATAQYQADVAMDERQKGVRNYGLFGQVQVANQQNYASGLALRGNGVGASLAGVNAQRIASNNQMAMDLVGVDRKSKQFSSIVGANVAAQQGYDTQSAQIKKNYGMDMTDLDYANQGATQSLNHDFFGSAMSGINAQRSRAASTYGANSGVYARMSQGLNVQARMAQNAEEDRSQAVGLDTSRIATSGRAGLLEGKGQDLHAAMESISGNRAADIRGVQGMNITDAEKSERISAIGLAAQGDISKLNRTARMRLYGGTATSIGNEMNFAGDSTRMRDPQEDIGDVVGKTGTNGALNNNMAAAQRDAQAAIAKRTAGNAAVGAANNQIQSGVAGKDAADMNAGGMGEILTLLRKIALAVPGALAAQ